MSKYNIGDKFLIEVEKVNDDEFGFLKDFYTIKGIESILSEEKLDKLEKISGRKIPPATLEEMKKEAYEKGMKEAWEIATDICCEECNGGMPLTKYHGIFGNDDYEGVMNSYTAQEAKAKIEVWEKEEKKKIHVGDVVINKYKPHLLILVTVFNEANYFNGIQVCKDCNNGFQGSVYSHLSIYDFEKTGKHFDLSQIFALADNNKENGINREIDIMKK